MFALLDCRKFAQVSKIRESRSKDYIYQYEFNCNGTEKNILECERKRNRRCTISAGVVCATGMTCIVF